MPPKRRRRAQIRVLKRPAANTSIVPHETAAATTTLAVRREQEIGPRADFRTKVASTRTTEWNVFVQNFRDAHGERLMKMNDRKQFLMRLRRRVEGMPRSDQLSSSVIDRVHKFMFGAMATLSKTGIADLTGQSRFVQVDATMELALIYFSEFSLGRHVAENWAANRAIEQRYLSCDGNEDDETPMVIKP